MRMLSLAHLTVLSLAPPEMVRVAARSGYDAVGLRMIAVTPDSPGYGLMNDAAMLRETRSAMADTGIRVNDIEFVKITPELDVKGLEPFLATGAELGAANVITAPYDPDLGRLADTLGAIADLAHGYGIMPVLEFFPWAVVQDLKGAADVVRAAARPNVGILVDALHFDRAGSTLEEIDALPASWLPFMHLCDAPAERPTTTEGLLHTARAERLPPGEGELRLAPLIARMPPDIPIGVEVPMDAMTRELGPEAVARRACAAARRLLSEVDGARR